MTIYLNHERSGQCLVTNTFLTCSWRFLLSYKLEQLEVKWKKMGFRNMQEKFENDFRKYCIWLVYILTCITMLVNGKVRIVMDGVGNSYWNWCLSFKLFKYRKQNWFKEDQMTKTGDPCVLFNSVTYQCESS